MGAGRRGRWVGGCWHLRHRVAAPGGRRLCRRCRAVAGLADADPPLRPRQRRPSLHPDPDPSKESALLKTASYDTGPFLLSLLPSNQSLPLVPSLCDLWFRNKTTSLQAQQGLESKSESPSPRAGFLCAEGESADQRGEKLAKANSSSQQMETQRSRPGKARSQVPPPAGPG